MEKAYREKNNNREGGQVRTKRENTHQNTK